MTDPITIEFDPSGVSQRLRYPRYESLIRYDLVRREYLQLEPAFKIADPEAGGRYEFTLAIAASSGAVFATDSGGLPKWREVASSLRPAFVSVDLLDDVTCKVTLDLQGWLQDDLNLYMVVVRIFCDEAGRPTDENDGVSIAFIRPGGTPLDHSDKAYDPSNPAAITISERFAAGIPTLPIYGIFKDFRLPSGFSLEPAFRVSEFRPNVDAVFALWARTHQFPPRSGGGKRDEVVVFSRGELGDRPTQLSWITAPTLQEFQFSWDRRIDPADHPRVFGFYVPVMTDGRVLYSDPIIFNDPPPPGLLT